MLVARGLRPSRRPIIAKLSLTATGEDIDVLFGPAQTGSPAGL